MPPQAEYIAISYVWGGVSQPNVCQSGRPPDKLPRTIEDAFIVASKVGIKLFWVESLCIDKENSTHK
ncbi:hypothetical protein BJ878DRAFT_413777 [Calycina marina]|uniref:Heterokaryon incompatibility domain-containing protein n=1 Tax=Calycina marina TaxID=1763456 RepID=A0A9P7ZA63_9HELO|nr:hypothetical protein BJ878DRAFT_413777 [Calycina marina]